VVGNLPFGAANSMLRRALDQASHISRLVLMFQREVALRLVAAPGTPAYSLLTVVTQQRAEVRRLFDVSPGSFSPRPAVSAAVVEIRPWSPPRLAPCCLEIHDELLRAVFGHRRKTLRNGLRRRAPWPAAIGLAVLDQLGISDQRRPQELSVEDYRRVAQQRCQRLSGEGAPT
jgi:16S rRNA (adenine1518-N6/adenine1519-N6)-dimethyltransferase